jgi:hypothetical protein
MGRWEVVEERGRAVLVVVAVRTEQEKKAWLEDTRSRRTTR